MLSTLTLLSLIGNALNVHLPFRFGSSEPGTIIRPAIFYIVEDVVAVDGNGGLAYREAFNARYESSEMFRNMIWNLSVCWMLAFYVMGAVVAVLVLILPVASVYAVGWAAPFPVVGLMVGATIFYVQGILRKEGKDGGEGEGVIVDDERAPLLNGGS
jgi:hypothetical protein